jgi:VanZ family protein
MGPHASRADDPGYSAMRLALALLGYFTFVTLVITLSPFDFAWRHVRVATAVNPVDFVLNVAMFLPIGFLLRSLGATRTRFGWSAVLVAFGFSAAIEAAQMLIPGRFVSPNDVVANTAGAWLGVWIRDRIERAAFWHPSSVGRIGLDIPVVGLIYLLVPQLWLSIVGMLDDRWRAVPMVLLLLTTASLLSDLRDHRGDSGDRRFEVDTLRRFIPLLALYLLVAALWPPLRALDDWHGELGIIDRLKGAKTMGMMLVLEQVGGFTLTGYAIAEWRSRHELTLREDLPLVAFVALTFATLVELTQGFLAGPGASLTAALLSTGAAVYGAAVYHVARTHVRVLRGHVSPRASRGETQDSQAA